MIPDAKRIEILQYLDQICSDADGFIGFAVKHQRCRTGGILLFDHRSHDREAGKVGKKCSCCLGYSIDHLLFLIREFFTAEMPADRFRRNVDIAY
ncbi:MAG: hypothetical protein A4E66_01949 [Syntrophus sp. PtaB.Bin001]|nr:MAG: hypothetical protein A4E66_01949 [Syntrophus sp. PtaB.Bin001]